MGVERNGPRKLDRVISEIFDFGHTRDGYGLTNLIVQPEDCI
jgi:hypothetical protein